MSGRDTPIIEGIRTIDKSHRARAASLGMLMIGIEREHPLYGARVAIMDFNVALWRYGSIERLELFVPPFSVERVRGFVGTTLAGYSAREAHVAVKSLYRIGQDAAPAIWHDVAADAYHPFRIRDAWAERNGNWFPITLTHHTVSYQLLVHSFFLPLVLDMTDGDTLVCTSRAARSAIGRMLDHVSGQLSQAVRSRVRFRGQLQVIPLGVDTAVFQPRDRLEARSELGIAPDAFVMLWNGRMSFLDKADLLPMAQALRGLVIRNPARRVQLVLSGSERSGEKVADALLAYARQLGVADSVCLLGQVPLARRPLLYAAADVFVSPVDNVQETFGLTPLEAMACGVPQVVADWDGYRDTVISGETGFLVPTYWTRCDDDIEAMHGVLDRGMLDHFSTSQSVVVDPVALQSSLQELLQNDNLRARMGAVSRRRAVAQFEWRHVIAQYEDLWNDRASVAKPRDWQPSQWHIPYFDVFQSYASRTLTDASVVRITEEGRRAISGDAAWPTYRLRDLLIDYEVVRDLLQVAVTVQQISLRELSAQVTQRSSSAVARVRRHAMWAAKYGLIDVAEPAAAGQTNRVDA